MIYIVDIDGTICHEVFLPSGSKDYKNHNPIYDRIEKINKLYEQGDEIHYWTARGAKSGIDYTELTTKQLDSWGCKYHHVSVGEKPLYDLLIDDKAKRIEEL